MNNSSGAVKAAYVVPGGDLCFVPWGALNPDLPVTSLPTGEKRLPLTAEKLYEKPLPPRLVVLSACETGMGPVIAGDGLLGLIPCFYLKEP